MHGRYGWIIGGLALALAACDGDDGGGGDPDVMVETDGSGGMGGMGGVGGGLEVDMGDPDMAEAVVDMGGPGPDAACRMACDRFLECAADVCTGDDLEDDCLEACGGNRSFPSVLDGIATCPDVVAFVEQQSPAVAMACDNEEPPVEQEPLCLEYGARAGECLAEICPPAGELGPGAASAFIDFCNNQITQGNIQPGQLANIRMAGCDNPLIGPIVDYVVADNGQPDSGAFEELCTEGVQWPADVCEAACDFLEMCIPEGTPENMGGGLRDEVTCRIICGISIPEVQRATWPCLASAEDCDAFGMCLQNPPPIEPEVDCAPFAARAAACMTEACPPLADSGLDMPPVVDFLCRQAVADGEVPAEVIEAIGPETPCDDEGLAGAVDFFTVGDPDDPDSGALGPLCAGDALPRPAELCDGACATISPCILPELGADAQILADAAVCSYVCRVGGDDIPDMVWQCATEAADCMAVYACFPGDEPPPEPAQ